MSAAVDSAYMDQEQGSAAAAALESERHRSVAEFFKETWSQALVAVSATEEEAQKILGKLTNWIEMGPDEAKRLSVELSEKLRRERNELEEGLEQAVRKALLPFRLPSREDLSQFHARLASLEARLDRLQAARDLAGDRLANGSAQ